MNTKITMPLMALLVLTMGISMNNAYGINTNVDGLEKFEVTLPSCEVLEINGKIRAHPTGEDAEFNFGVKYGQDEVYADWTVPDSVSVVRHATTPTDVDTCEEQEFEQIWMKVYHNDAQCVSGDWRLTHAEAIGSCDDFVEWEEGDSYEIEFQLRYDGRPATVITYEGII